MVAAQKSLGILFGLLAGIACHAPQGTRAHAVYGSFGQVLPAGEATSHGDKFDWQNLGPREFLDQLRSTSGYTVQGIHRGWVRLSDLPALVALLDSTEPCGSVALSWSSYADPHPSTLGVEAAFLIEGYRRGEYPPGLNSTTAGLSSVELRAWWSTVESGNGT